MAGLKVSSVTLDGSGCMCIPTYRQDAEPTLAANDNVCIWVDTNDNNRVYFVFRRASEDQVMVDLT